MATTTINISIKKRIFTSIFMWIIADLLLANSFIGFNINKNSNGTFNIIDDDDGKLIFFSFLN